jgi:hypothetical protein
VDSKEGKMIDRSEVNRALAKALAFKQCGKDAEASAWARKLVELLKCSEILKEQEWNEWLDGDSTPEGSN